MNDLDTIDALEQVQDSEQIQQIVVSEIDQTHTNLVKSSMKRAWQNWQNPFVKTESSNQSSFVSRKLRLRACGWERRLRASKLAEKETIPAIVRDYSEETMIQIAVVENCNVKTWNH